MITRVKKIVTRLRYGEKHVLIYGAGARGRQFVAGEVVGKSADRAGDLLGSKEGLGHLPEKIRSK